MIQDFNSLQKNETGLTAKGVTAIDSEHGHSRVNTEQIKNSKIAIDTYLKIYTLGRFSVECDGVILSEKSGRSNKLWTLFKFLLTYRGKSIPPDNIIDMLWPDSDTVRPISALQDLIYRLRKMFENELSTGNFPIQIEFSQGCYCLQLMNNCWLDLDEFTRLSDEASSLAIQKPEQAKDLYQRAITLYKGEYLPGCQYSWLIPSKRYYRELFLVNNMALTRILQSKNDNEAIKRTLESAMLIDSFTEKEEFHLQYMKTLMNLGDIGDAIKHYESNTRIINKEYGIKPSTSMREFYRLLKGDMDVKDLKLSHIKKQLDDYYETQEAHQCDREFFTMLYCKEKFRGKHNVQVAWIGLITLLKPDKNYPEKVDLTPALSTLKRALSKNLRVEDAYCQWNRFHFLVLLPGLDQKKAEALLSRVEGSFLDQYDKKNIILSCQVQRV